MVKAITIYICVVAGIACLWAVGGREYYTLYGSQSPHPELGQTVPMAVNFGKTVYITPKESNMIDVGNSIAITIVTISLVGLIFWPTKKTPVS